MTRDWEKRSKLRERTSLCQLLSRQFYRSMSDGRASLIITLARPKAPFGKHLSTVESPFVASILKETIRPIAKRTAGPIKLYMHTPWKTCGGGERNSADRFSTASLGKISRRK